MFSAFTSKEYASMPERKEPLMGQNYMCIVCHDDKLLEHHRQDLKLRTENLFYYPRFFDNVLSFSTYVKDPFIVKKIIFILIGSTAGFLCGVVKRRKKPPSDPLVYEMQFGKENIRSDLEADRQFQCIDRLFEKIIDDLKAILINENSIDSTPIDDHEKTQHLTLPMGILDPKMKQKSFCLLNRDALKFHLFQSFIQVMLNLQISDDDIENMWISCRQESNYQKESHHLKKINEFADTYNEVDALRFYTENTFLFRYVNKALRRENVMQVFDFRPLITHIHQKLSHLRTEQSDTGRLGQNQLYRGKKLPTSVLQQLRDNIGHLISMNGFLSTTKSTDVSKMFADDLNTRMGYETVIFEMHLDPSQIKKTIETQPPFAYIAEQSHIRDEDEVLFFMGFVWRIKSVIEPTSDNKWTVLLELCPSDEFRPIKKPNECSYFTLGQILHELGEYTDAIFCYDRMLESASTLPSKEQIDFHCQYAKSAYMNRSYKDALDHLNQADNLFNEVKKSSETTSTSSSDVSNKNDEHSSMSIITSKGLVYQKMKKPSMARTEFRKAQEKEGSPKQKANLYYCGGVFETECGHYPEALNSYHQAKTFSEEAGDQKLKMESQQRIEIISQVVV